MIPPPGPRSDHHLLGSNLSDEEFKILLEVVGTSHDGKISLSEFDKIAKCSMINSSNGIKQGTLNNDKTNNNNDRDNNDSLASNSTHEYANRNVEHDVLDYEKFDKKNKIDRDRVREIRRNSARNISVYNNEEDLNTLSNSPVCQFRYQSTEGPHQMPRGRDLFPDNRARRSHSLNGLVSPRPSRPQGIQGSFRQGENIWIGPFNDEI